MVQGMWGVDLKYWGKFVKGPVFLWDPNTGSRVTATLKKSPHAFLKGFGSYGFMVELREGSSEQLWQGLRLLRPP